ncbi:DUF6961 family protein [Sphingobium cupriresistens]|uniref:DUF6961 family protein n=1 Tax=Sphingobium cupriresistens TaxID=1132417 RepID=UPI000831BED3|nr:hypothetical protein [Sphingobium cupriresistens]
MAQLTDWELWACAQRVIKEHGADAPEHVATMIARMVAAANEGGIVTWQAIAERVDQLMDYRTGRPLSKQ